MLAKGYPKTVNKDAVSRSRDLTKTKTKTKQKKKNMKKCNKLNGKSIIKKKMYTIS